MYLIIYLYFNENYTITCLAIVSTCEVCICAGGLSEWVTSTEKLGNQDKYLEPRKIYVLENNTCKMLQTFNIHIAWTVFYYELPSIKLFLVACSGNHMFCIHD